MNPLHILGLTNHLRGALALSIAAALPFVGMCTALAQALAPGQIVGWGDNGAGQNNAPAGLTDVKSIVAGYRYTLALKKDGTVVGWGDGPPLTIPAGLSGVASIVAGTYFAAALKTNGTVVAWGSNTNGETDVPPGLTGVTQIAAQADGFHTLALKSDGTVVGWGYNGHEEATSPAGLTGVKQVAAGTSWSAALKTDGSVVVWGYGGDGELNLPTNLGTVKSITLGSWHGLVLRDDGTVLAWGNNTYGQTNVPATLSGVVALAAGGYHSLALKSDTTVVGWGSNYSGESNVPTGLSNVTTISASHSPSSLAANLPTVNPYSFIGFFAPLSNPALVNLGKAGRTYPVKWQLKDTSGNFVSKLGAVKSITYKPAQCGSFSGVVDVLETETSGQSALTYDVAENQYAYNWKTPSVAGCYTLFLSLDSGQVEQAYFNLKQ